MKTVLLKFISNPTLRQIITDDRDRTMMFSALSLPIALILALVKVGLGLYYLSAWLIGFGIYYLILVAAKSWVLRRYSLLRRQHASETELGLEEHREIIFGGGMLTFVGALFVGFSFAMYSNWYSESFGKWPAILLATIGFTKLISAIVGQIRGRRHKSPLVSILKSFNLANGLVAIVLTQYALLTFQKSPQVNVSTGMFGMGIGCLLVLVGCWYVFKSVRVIQS